MNMKFIKGFFAAVLAASMIVGCDDDSSSVSAPKDDPVSSSSAEERSSSSVILSDSDIESSGTSSPYEFLSSAEEESSSSSEVAVSSSSIVANSSSSNDDVDRSSSSDFETESSSSSSWSSAAAIGSSSSIDSSNSFNDGSEYDATANTLKDLRDGHTYKTVTIGTQIWMAENLNYAYTGVPYQFVKYTSFSSDSTSWCYDNEVANCDKYGRLYTWAAAIDSVALANNADNPQICGYDKTCMLSTVTRGVCPSGWHLPSMDEFITLMDAVGGYTTLGIVLKSQIGWESKEGVPAGTDTYGFSALPAGLGFYDGAFSIVGKLAYFWSSSEDQSDGAYGLDLSYDDEEGDIVGRIKSCAFSVRCVKD